MNTDNNHTALKLLRALPLAAIVMAGGIGVLSQSPAEKEAMRTPAFLRECNASLYNDIRNTCGKNITKEGMINCYERLITSLEKKYNLDARAVLLGTHYATKAEADAANIYHAALLTRQALYHGKISAEEVFSNLDKFCKEHPTPTCVQKGATKQNNSTKERVRNA